MTPTSLPEAGRTTTLTGTGRGRAASAGDRGWHPDEVTLLVRRATPQDAAGIARVHVRGWQVGYRGLVPDAVLDALSPTDRAVTWRARLEHPAATDATTSVVVDRDEVLGFASVGAARDADATPTTFELWALYVDPGRWRTGVGGALDDAVTDQLRALGAARATLWVLTQNHRARAFYESRGWEAEGATRVDRRAGPVPVDLFETRYARPVRAV